MIRLTAVIEIEGQAPRALTHESNARSIVLGRDETADFQLPISTVSRHHARIHETDQVYTIEDLGSTHGTLVNGRKLASGEKKVLRHGDMIELTKAKITCSIDIEKVSMIEPGDGTQVIAAKAVQGILGRLGAPKTEGPYLRVLNGADENTRFALGGELSEWTLGRSKECECVLNDLNVSRRHAVIKKDWSGFVVEDLGSKNGVLVNEQRVSHKSRLRDKDELTVGPIKLLFVDPDAELLAALKDVPGFEIEESQPNQPASLPHGQLAKPDLEDESSAGSAFFPELENSRPKANLPNSQEVDLAAEIDPDLLLDTPKQSKLDWLFIGGLLSLACGAVLVLYLILS